MINDDENEAKNEKQIKDTKEIDLGLDMDINILNINCVSVL